MKILINKLRNTSFLAVLALIVLAACTGYEPEVKKQSESGEVPTKSVVDVLDERGYTVFADAVVHAGIASDISAAGDSVTIFAPNNEAFVALFASLGVSNITEVDAATLGAILKYHVVAGAYNSNNLPASAATLESSSLFIVGGSVNGKSAIVETDIYGNDGLAHGIGSVLSIPASSIYASLSADADFSTLVTAIDYAGLTATLSGSTELTILAPNNDAFTNAGITDVTTFTVEQMNEILSYHVISGRVYSQNFPESGGTLAPILGGEADGIPEIVYSAEAPASFNGAAAVSLNTNTGNGVIHEVGGIVNQALTLNDALFNVDVSFGNDGILTDLFADIVSASGYTAFDDLSAYYSVYTQLFGPSSSDFGGDTDAMIDYIESRTFEGRVEILSAANGTKITSLNGNNYYIAATGGAEYVNGGGTARNAFGAGSGTDAEAAAGPLYNGYIAHFSVGSFVPLPAENIADVLAAEDTTSLIGAAIKVTGKLTSGDNTFFAVGNSVFTAYTGYTSAADIDTLSAGEDNDQAMLDALAEVIDRHTIAGNVQFSVVISSEVPTLTNALEEEVLFSVVDGNLVIIGDVKNVSASTYSLIAVDALASNGVIHVLDGVLEIAE